jgi:hypothetical protein
MRYSVARNMFAIDVLRQTIKNLYLEECFFQLLEHSVSINWRQRYPSTQNKLENMNEALKQESPLKTQLVKGSELVKPNYSYENLISMKSNVLSIASKFYLQNKKIMHLPLMNFHPNDAIDLAVLLEVVKRICGKKKGISWKRVDIGTIGESGF